MMKFCSPITRLLRSAFVVFALSTNTLHSAVPWIRLSTANFDIYTSRKVSQAKDLLRSLEDARSCRTVFPGQPTSQLKPIRVIAFRSESEFAPYRLPGHASAYYLHAAGETYIVLQDASPENDRAALHEYAHHLIRQCYPRLPLWLDEGLSDVFSTVKREGADVVIGLPVEARLDYLKQNGLALSLPALFQTTRKSLASSDQENSNVAFYAESWLLAHMLRFSPGYSPVFTSFLEALESQSDAIEALRETVHKSPEVVRDDLERYLRMGKLPTQRVAVADGSVQPSSEARRITDADVHIVLADLLAALHDFSK
jgi:hypothetical protein